MSNYSPGRQPSHQATCNERLVVTHVGILEWGFTGRGGELASLDDGARLMVYGNPGPSNVPWIKELAPGMEVTFHQFHHDSMGQIDDPQISKSQSSPYTDY